MKLKLHRLFFALFCLLFATGTCLAAPAQVPDGFYAGHQVLFRELTDK